jgi:holo-[acyl-carrier protein] synthase
VIIGIGTDLVDVARIESSLSRWGDRFCNKILNSSELKDYQNSRQKPHFLAKRFAAKEAASKALGTGMRQGVSFKQLVIQHHDTGAPILRFIDKAREIAELKGVTDCHVSVSDEQHYALAFVVLSGSD